MTVLERISHETMVFMRGKYRRDDKFSCLIIFGKKEREILCFK